MEKTEYVEGRESWEKEYGTIIDQLPNIYANIKIINKFIDLSSKKLNILEYGCGYGYYLQFLSTMNKHECFGVELARHAVEYANKRIGNNSVFWQSCGDVLPLKDKSIDLIFSFDMIEHVENNLEIENMLKESQRLLKDDGLLLIKTPCGNRRTRILAFLLGKKGIFDKRGDHKNIFDDTRLKRLVSSHFEVDTILYGINVCCNLYYRLKLHKLFHSMKFGSMIFVCVKRKVIKAGY